MRELHCIFPFEEGFFQSRGVNAHYIGHPLPKIIGPRYSREEFFRKHRLPEERPLVTLCPGSRRGEIGRHFPALSDAMGRMAAARACTFVVAAPRGTSERFGAGFFDPLVADGRARLVEGETWDAMAHSNVTLAASGTVTIEAALLGAPMVTYYRVTAATWFLGRRLVRVPFLSMVNLVAGRKVVPELIQDDMTGQAVAGEALGLLNSPQATAEMKAALAEVREALDAGHCPFEESAQRILASIEEDAD